MDELTIGDKIYISSKQAAKITGYAKDYVGQLCREGRVEARLVGRNWYVLESSIREHRFGGEAKVSDRVEVVPEPKESPVRAWEAPTYAPMADEGLMPTLNTVERPLAKPETAEAVALMQDAWKEWFATRPQALPDGEKDFNEESLPMVVAEEKLEEEAIEEVRESDISSNEAIFEVSQAEEEYEIPVHRIEEVPTVEESIMVHSYTSEHVSSNVSETYGPKGSVIDLSRASTEEYVYPEPVVVARPHRRKRRRSARSPLTVRAIILSMAGLIALVAIIGSGAFDTTLAEQGIGNSLRGAIFDTLRGETVIKK